MEHMASSVIAIWRAKWEWCANFDDRELAEIILAIHYRDDFAHGTNGHLAYITLAKVFDVVVSVAKEIPYADKNRTA